MHIWSPVNGAIVIKCGPLRPCRFTARMRLQLGNPSREIIGQPQPDGTVDFAVPAADVQDIKAGTTRLMLVTSHTLIPGSADARWGWRYTVIQAGGQASLTEDGTPVPLGQQGYFDSPLTPYAGATIGRTNKLIKVR